MEKTWLDRGTLQSEVEISDRTEQLIVSSMVQFEKSELAKLGIDSKSMRPAYFGKHYMLLLTFACSLYGTMNCSDRSLLLPGPILLLFYRWHMRI